MRFARFTTEPNSGLNWGIILDDGGEASVLDLTAARSHGHELPRSLNELLSLSHDSRADATATISALSRTRDWRVGLSEVTLHAPLDASRNIFAAGANYRGHVEESEHSAAAPSEPIFFTKATTTITGPGTIQVDPALTQKVDWEAELAVVLGSGGRYLGLAEAQDAVFGYVVANDLSARDQQHGRPEGQWFIGKSLDYFCPIGPWLTTADEVPDPTDLTVRLTVNETLKQDAQVADMIFSIPELIGELSRFITLQVGDIILTGTPAGVGDARNPREYLTHGDTVVAEISGLGQLSNQIQFVSRAAS